MTDSSGVPTTGNQPEPTEKPGKSEVNLQELADRILKLMKDDARIERERLGKRESRSKKA